MREIVTEVEIAASPSRVWSILTDLDHFSEWNPFISEATGVVQEGAGLKVHIAPPGGKPMTFTPRVTRVVPEREFRWLGRLLMPGLFDGEHIFEIKPLGENRSSLVQREEFRGLLVPLLWSSLDTRTRQGFNDMNAALKVKAEKDQADLRRQRTD